jgi:NOL1/NOP2/fmu family ribosome biogenesis protein
MDGLRVVSPGLGLARVYPGRLEPMHALAMACPGLPSASLDGSAARSYLRGEAVPCGGAGWLVATFEGMPLGWGKASGGLLKNHLPKGIR